MRTILAAAPHADTFDYSMPPPGLLRLGGELLRRGIPVELEDLAYRLAAGEIPGDDRLAEAAAARLCAAGPPDVLGLSVMGATLPIALAIARLVRRRALAVRIVLGGPGTTGVDQALVERFEWIDAVVRGEGEGTLPELLACWRRGAEPRGVRGLTRRARPGVALREEERDPLDPGELPPYAWELLPPIADYKRITGEKEGLVPIDSGRGCVYDCSFCTIGRFWGRRSRVLPVERLVAEVAALREIPGAGSAYLCHDLFGADRKHAVAFCEELLRREVGVPWEARARIDHLDDELIELMGRAGCHRVLLGVESADPHVRNGNGKRMSPGLDVLHTLERLAGCGIAPILSLILGLPGEDEPALRRTLDLARDASLAVGVNLSFHLVNPQPGCRLGDDHGAASHPIEGIPPDMALGAGETQAERELIAAHPDLFGSWALLTSLPGGEEHLKDLHEIARDLPAVLMRYPRTFALLCRLRGSGGGDTLDLYRAWRERSVSFADFARGRGEDLVDDFLRWEEAVRTANGAARVVRTRFDLPAVAKALSGSRGPLHSARGASALAVVTSARGVRTLRVSAAVADLLETPRSDLDPAERSFLERAGLLGPAEGPPLSTPDHR